MNTVTARPILEQYVTETADHYVDTDAELGLTESEARRVRIAYNRAHNAYAANHLGCLAEHAEIVGLKAAHAEHKRVLAERAPVVHIHSKEDELWWAQMRDAEERSFRTVAPETPKVAETEEQGSVASEVAMPLPTIDGRGLTEPEQRRVNRAKSRAKAAYVHDCPEASHAEVEIVARKAATDELRRVLKDRPPYRVIRASQTAKRWMPTDNTDAPHDHAGSFVGHH